MENNNQTTFEEYCDQDRYFYQRLSNWGNSDEYDWSSDYSNESWYNKEVLVQGKIK
jgi:hypothetical protein